MNTSSNTVLNNALMHHIFTGLHRGNTAAIKQIGMTDETIEEMESLSAHEFAHIVGINLNFVKIEVDNDLLLRMIHRVKEEASSRKALAQLIDHGATLELANELTGISGVEFAEMRRRQSITQKGRTQKPSEAEETRVYKAWRQFKLRLDLTIDEWLEISKLTDINLAIIYRIIRGSKQAETKAVKNAPKAPVTPIRTSKGSCGNYQAELKTPQTRGK